MPQDPAASTSDSSGSSDQPTRRIAAEPDDADRLRELLLSTAPLTGAQARALLETAGTPIVTDDPDHPGRQRFLFGWPDSADGPPPAGIYLWANRLTDKSRIPAGLMHRRPGGGAWLVELTAERTVLAGYRVYPFTAASPAVRDGAVVYSRELVREARIDPRNRPARNGAPFGSVLAGSAAPSIREWTAPPAQPGARTEPRTVTVGGAPVRGRLRLPAPDGPASLLIVFDAELWIGRYRLPEVLDAAYRAGRCRERYAVFGIDSPPDPGSRLALLGGNTALAAAVAAALPAVRAGMPAPPLRTVVAGQSLGAMTALTLAARHPGAVDEVLAYSPSVWWRPGLTSRPDDVRRREDWVHRLLRESPARSVRLRLAVGDYEDELAPRVADLADTAREAGYPVTVDRYCGGHDACCWAALLLQHLR